MCGIVGLITTNRLANATGKRAFIEQALFVGTLRGKDGTGMFAVQKPEWRRQGEPFVEQEAHWIRAPSIGPEFLADKRVKGLLARMSDYMAVIGHNRAATLGSAVMENTHPFVEGPITLVHNGTLSNHDDLPKSGEGVGFNVDSHAIAHALATESADKVVAQLDGAFALVWHDARDGSLNIIRNSRRPIHLGVLNDNETILIASEVEMLRWLAFRNSLPIKTCIQPDPGVLFTWQADAKNCTPTTRRLRMHIPTYNYNQRRQQHYGGGYGGYSEYGQYAEWASIGKKQTAPTAGSSAESANRATLPVLKADNKVHEPVRKVYSGGNPAPMIEALADEALSTDDTMLFTTMAIDTVSLKGGRMVGRITGTVGAGQVSASVYNVPIGKVIPGKEQHWIVSPIGVRAWGTGETEVICHVVSYGVDPATFVPDYEYSDDAYFLYEGIEQDDAIAGEVEDDVEEDEATTLVDALGKCTPIPLCHTGPYGAKVSARRFIELTQGGCTMCSRPIPLVDSEEILWSTYAGLPAPVCVQCVEEGDYAKAASRVRV